MGRVICGRHPQLGTFGPTDLTRLVPIFEFVPDPFATSLSDQGCSGSEAGSYLRLIDFVYHSTLGLRVIKKKVAVLFRQ